MQTSKPRFTLGLIATAVFSLSACGGGTTAANNVVPAPVLAKTSQTITVMDGLIQNALVCVDSNANGACDPTETQGHTDANGQVTLEIPVTDLANSKIVAEITAGVSTDKDTGTISTSYTLQSPVGKLDVVSPLTNMVQTKIDADHAMGISTSVDDADKYVMGQLGLNPALVSALDNFVARREAGSTEHSKAGDRAHILVMSTQASTTALAQSNPNSTSIDTNHAMGSTDVHTLTIEVSNNLLTRLPEIGHVADSVESQACATNSSNVARDCGAEIENEMHHGGLDGTGTGTGTGGTGGAGAVTASASAGKALYVANGCGACHGNPPSTSNILQGANSPTAIANAVGSVGMMSGLMGKFTAQNLADLAAYLATPSI